MDTEQIQQQMRNRRAAIDYKIDLLNLRGRAARHQLVPMAAVVAVVLAGSFVVRRYLRSRRRTAARRRLRIVAA